MTEAKHTPGPWLPSKFGFQVLTGDSWSTVCTLSGPAEWEDGRGKYSQEYEWQLQEANARLIAAAPDLLLALAWLHDLEQGRHATEYQEQKLLAMGAARAAIAKATGEA